MAISKKQILKTTLLPGIWPRTKNLLGSGFEFLAYLIAVVYNTVRILPNDHKYLKPSNIGTFSVKDAISAAANNIEIKIKNTDQIIIFFSIIAAMIILVVQFVLLIAVAIIPNAFAQEMPSSILGFFETPNPSEDIAFRMLDLVFGIPDFFGSKEETATSFHTALHGLLEFYSHSMLVVATIIIVYLIVAIVAETAQSGIPFGQRFNKTWAPVRLILFFGLLIPISNGLNGAQYITFLSAKLGSGLASTGWILFNEKINEASETLTGRTEQNVAYPEAPEFTGLPAYMMVAKTCQLAYAKSYDGGVDGLFSTYWDPTGDSTGVKAWAVIETETGHSAELMTGDGASFQDLSARSKGRDIRIVFGVRDPENEKDLPGNIYPACGEVILRVTDVSEPGAAVINSGYYQLVHDMWGGNSEADAEGNTDNGLNNLHLYAQSYVDRGLTIERNSEGPMPPDDYPNIWEIYLKEYMEGGDDSDGLINQAVEAQIAAGDWEMPDSIRNLGWGGAGIWYNKIAQQNGALASAIQQVPIQYLYPSVMERVAKIKQQTGTNPNINERFNPAFNDEGGTVDHEIPIEDEIALTLNDVYTFWQSSESQAQELSGNFIIDTINLLLGTEGLFEICRNTDIHPLAQLSVLGKSLLDRSIQSFAIGGALGVLSAIPSPFGEGLASMGKMFSTFAGVGLLVGFVLFYVLPFLPFLYFFFAVGNWVKGIFEAIVAMPLWALAHLRIDGEGIVGDAAIGGYYLIFEIFIRPILIVFGLLAAVTIFAAMVKVLNETFYLVISNLSGHDPKGSDLCFQQPGQTEGQTAISEAGRAELKDAYRGPVDEFFYTIVYTILVYMIGTACFKLIDRIPNDILRWINAEIPSFNDGAGDSAAGLMKYVTIGAERFGGSIGSSLEGVGGGVKQSIQQFMQSR